MFEVDLLSSTAAQWRGWGLQALQREEVRRKEGRGRGRLALVPAGGKRTWAGQLVGSVASKLPPLLELFQVGSCEPADWAEALVPASGAAPCRPGSTAETSRSPSRRRRAPAHLPTSVVAPAAVSEMERLALETVAHSSSAPIGNLRLLSHFVSGGAGKPLAVGIGLSLQRSWGRGVVRLL